ncbi:MAG TPA: hypothetical protein VEY89_05535 [Candidatus Dormibacteraeota bacterium]|nr:hypothetical protein [Candidatus Dormibacteraeota bacterium]
MASNTPPSQPPQGPPYGPPGAPPSAPPTGYPAAPGYPPAYGQSYTGQPYAAQPYVAGPRLPIKRNAMLILAQVLAIIQGVLGILLAAGLVLLGLALNGAISGIDVHNVNGFDFANGAAGFLFGFAVVVLVVSVLVIIAAVRTGHPSQVARWLLAAFEILLFIGSLQGLLLRTTVNGNGGSVIYSIVVLVIEGLVIYGLIIDPATYRAFARKNLP